MAKKYLLVLALAVGVATGAFAQSWWSIGGGMIFETGSLGSGWAGSSTSEREYASLRQTGFGAWAFVDATFAELSFSLIRGSHTIQHFGESSGAVTILNATLLGKLPIFLGWGDIFPLLGVGYQITIAQELDLGWEKFSFSIMFGVGSDFDFARNIFIRASILGSYRISGWEYQGRGMGASGGTFSEEGNGSGGFGVTIKAAVGFRL